MASSRCIVRRCVAAAACALAGCAAGPDFEAPQPPAVTAYLRGAAPLPPTLAARAEQAGHALRAVSLALAGNVVASAIDARHSAKPSSPRAKAWICRPFASSRAWPATWRVLVTQRLHQQAVIAYVDARAARLADTARLFAALGGAAPEADAGVAAEEGAGPP